ncbi:MULTISPECIES: hypothetical protein [unclassified Methylophaga]|uniref:hypothetical protein n=1 Tax=unclassified Methylophaga TaxID=2629249 RepID=UPI000C8F8E54|nr:MULTISPECIES: hypothetical protein [unclassified Methylophaga]MBN45743.1 hypothetical protein [Methylophaga sp.]|tara:strand:- start:70264 stop:70761 length:498 start_codon:yes stop_codon:yes gene_type:complete
MKHPSIPTIGALWLISSVSLLSGCGGEFSYKRGATAQDFQSEKQRCEKGTSSEKEIDQCLQQQGWLVVGPDKPFIPLSRGESKTIAVADDAMAEVDDQPVDPMEKLQVNSWWRMGAGPEKLMADSEACVAELGEAHSPEANMSLVTRGLLGCMQKKGWAALLQQQ